MLKKLMKYGNSHAILLNRSILDLLGLSGGDSVKLTIQGDTLLIKKAESVSEWDRLEFASEESKQKKVLDEQASMGRIQKSVEETMQDVLNNGQNLSDEELGQALQESMKNTIMGQDVKPSIKERFLKTFNQRVNEMSDITQRMAANENYMREWIALGDKRSTMSEKEFANVALSIRYKYFPELREIDLEHMEQAESNS